LLSQIVMKVPDNWRPLQGMCEHQDNDSNRIHQVANLRLIELVANLVECDVVIWIQEGVKEVEAENHFPFHALTWVERFAFAGVGVVSVLKLPRTLGAPTLGLLLPLPVARLVLALAAAAAPPLGQINPVLADLNAFFVSSLVQSLRAPVHAAIAAAFTQLLRFGFIRREHRCMALGFMLGVMREFRFRRDLGFTLNMRCDFRLRVINTLLWGALTGLPTRRDLKDKVSEDMSFHLRHGAATHGIPLKPQLDQCHRGFRHAVPWEGHVVLADKFRQGPIDGIALKETLECAPKRQG